MLQEIMLDDNDDDDEFGGGKITIEQLRAKIQPSETTDDDDDEFGGGRITIEQLRAKIQPSETTDDDDDEFGGGRITIEQLRAKIQPSKTTDDDDEFGGGKVDIKQLREKSTTAKNKSVVEILELPIDWDHIGGDSEYWARTNKPTMPLCISLYSAGNHAEYLHPNSHPGKYDFVLVDVKRKMKLLGELQSLRVFQTPFVILDFLQDIYKIQWRPIKDLRRKRVHTLKIYLFFSFKDLQFLFARDADFLYYCLQYLERIRRITTKFNKPIALPYEALLPSEHGMKWTALSMEVIDVCAMQGAKSLKVYLQNVGLPDDSKDLWDWNVNNNPMDFLMSRPRDFLTYIRNDVRHLKAVRTKTNEFYNDIAKTVGVDSNEDWGLSTGKITARIASEWLAARPNIGLPTKETKETKQLNIKPFYWYNRLASPEAMKQLSHLVGNQTLLYLGMTDGGRCVKERSKISFLNGALVDIDINGCYGNGLKNQIFPIGNPSLQALPMKFKDWEETYSKYLIPGLWVARISWKNAPFKQDLLLSKVQKVFTAWDWYQSHFAENSSDADKQYDASMYMGTNEVCTAALNHDLYQVIKKYTSNEEYAWIRENAIIDCFAYYDKRDEIEKIIPEMCEMRSMKELGVSGINWCTKWVRVDLKDLADPLLNRRSDHKDKLKLYNTQFSKDNKEVTAIDVPDYQVIDGVEFSKTDWKYHNSVQEFIKLIVNTIYGCIASTYFAGDGTGISNFIVGNNITARARTLAWCMAKGLYSLMSVTDGGVFDANEIAFYIRKSLDIFTNLGFDILKGSNGQPVVEIKPLFDRIIAQDASMFEMLDKKNHVQKLAWNHLKSQFGELDIFKYDQFSFEVKKLYTECQIRNKSDYRLYNAVNGEELIKIRGLSKKSGKDGDDVASSIFEDIINDEAGVHELETRRLLGLSEWREMNSEKRKELLPHDEISENKKFYSLTPLGCKFVNSEHHNDVMRLYQQLKQYETPELVAELAMLEEIYSEKDYVVVKQQLRDRAKSISKSKSAHKN